MNTSSIDHTDMSYTKETSVSISKPVYYAVSMLTLGLPQMAKATRYLYKTVKTPNDPDLSMAYMAHFFGMEVTGLTVLAQATVVGYSIYSTLEKMIN